MSKPYYEILIHPLYTEKASHLRSTQNQYSFLVRLDSNKVEIRRAVEERFQVTVTDVHTVIVRGKVKRVGRNFGKRPNHKKAIVTVADGQSIELFETN